jgi:Tetratricopeptide repeat
VLSGALVAEATRLVQAVTADQMPAELAAWRQAAAAVIDAAIPEDPQRPDTHVYRSSPDTWPDFAALLPHAQAALTADSIGMGRIADYLGSSGNDVAARELYRRVVKARERVLGPEHPETLAARARLAWWTGDSGDAAGARDQYAALLPIRARVSGPGRPETLADCADLAWWTGQAGDAAAARDQYAALLPIRARVSGPGAPGNPGRPRCSRPLDRGCGGCGRGPRPARRAAARHRAGPRPGAPGHPSRPGRATLLDKRSGS